MDQSYCLLNENINELLKMSKQFQNNMRQELRRQDGNSSFVAESCFSVWEDSSSCLRDVVVNVADCLDNGLNSNDKSVETDVKKSLKLMEQAKSIRQVRERRIPPANQPVLVSKKATPKAIRPQYQSKRPNMPVVSSKPNIESSKSTIKPSTSTTTVHRLPLQRFAGTLRGSIDFSKEHPDLELDVSSSRTTLFPRRFYRGTELISPERESINLATAEEKPPIKKKETWKEVLANNPTKPQPQRILPLKKVIADLDTCKMAPVPRIEESKGLDIISTPGQGLYQIGKQSEMRMKHEKYNQQNFPVMYVRPEFQVQRVASIAIHGNNRTIHTTEQHSSMNIKYVECTHEEKQDNEVRSSSPKEEEHVEHCANTPNVEPLVKNQCTPKEKNKYFKALEITELPKNSSISTDYSSSMSKSVSKRSSRYSSSSEYSRHSSKSKEASSTTSLNDNQDIIEQMLSSTERPLSPTTKESKGTPQTQRDVYVQTEYKRKPTPPPTPPRTVYVQTDNTANAATSTTPPRLTPPIIISTPNQPTDVSRTVEDIYVDDDFISKIFDRINNDLPNALHAFKTRNTTTPRETEATHSNEREDQAQMHRESLMDHHQTFTPNVTSNVEIEPRLSRIQVHPHTTLEMPPPVQNPCCDLPNTMQAFKAPNITTPRDKAPFHFNEKQEQARMHRENQMNYYQTSTANDTSNVEIEPRLSRIQVQPHTMLVMAPPVENSSFKLLQQNPLFTRTINKIKSSTVDGTTAIDDAMEETHRRLTDAEIKRAVKVFLDSLDGNEERKSIIRDGGDGTGVILSRSQLLRHRAMTFSKTDSSDPSNSSSSSKSNSLRGRRRCVKKRINLPDGLGLSRSSTTTSVYSSDLETESDVTIDQQSNKATENSLSEGEVLSMGEVS